MVRQVRHFHVGWRGEEFLCKLSWFFLRSLLGPPSKGACDRQELFFYCVLTEIGIQFAKMNMNHLQTFENSFAARFYCLKWLQRNLPERSPLVSDHLTKIPIGSSVSQIAVSETSRKRPPNQNPDWFFRQSNCY